jgi:hypothetical protein
MLVTQAAIWQDTARIREEFTDLFEHRKVGTTYEYRSRIECPKGVEAKKPKGTTVEELLSEFGLNAHWKEHISERVAEARKLFPITKANELARLELPVTKYSNLSCNFGIEKLSHMPDGYRLINLLTEYADELEERPDCNEVLALGSALAEMDVALEKVVRKHRSCMRSMPRPKPTPRFGFVRKA